MKVYKLVYTDYSITINKNLNEIFFKVNPRFKQKLFL